MLEKIEEIEGLLDQKTLTAGHLTVIYESILQLMRVEVETIDEDYLNNLIRILDKYKGLRKNYSKYGKDSRFTKDVVLCKLPKLSRFDLVANLRVSRDSYNRFKELREVTNNKFNILQYNQRYFYEIVYYFLCKHWKDTKFELSSNNNLHSFLENIENTEPKKLIKHISVEQCKLLLAIANIINSSPHKVVSVGNSMDYLPERVRSLDLITNKLRDILNLEVL